MDWLRYSDEEGFEDRSDLVGSVDISNGVRLLVYSELGSNSPDVPPGTFAQAALAILETERVRARKDYEKMKKFFA